MRAAKENPFKMAQTRSEHSSFGPGPSRAKRRASDRSPASRAIVFVVMTCVWSTLTAFFLVLYLRQPERDFPMMALMAAVMTGCHIALLPGSIRGRHAPGAAAAVGHADGPCDDLLRSQSRR
jgi:hypothetical protein